MFPRSLGSLALICIVSILSVNCNPKYGDERFLPSSLIYLEKSENALDQMALPSQPKFRNDAPTKRTDSDPNDLSDRNQEARFGFTNVGHTGTGYGVSPYTPAKIDLGGLLVGAIIGIGSILIIPKILYVLSGTYGSYARSEESGFAQTLTKLDDMLARHGVDTNSCMQRAACTYSQQAAIAGSARGGGKKEDFHEEEPSSFYLMLDGITSNEIFRTALEGTAIKEAVQVGRTGGNCTRSYPHCGLSVETLFSFLTNVFSAITTVNVNATTPTPQSALTLQ